MSHSIFRTRFLNNFSLRQKTSSIFSIPEKARSYATYPSNVFRITPEVTHAIATNQPIVALESAMYTHGYPPADMVDSALHVEFVARSHGVIPATIGVLDGVARVGLEKEELVRLVSMAGDKNVMKVSRRDLAHIVGLGLAGKRLHGGTTISGTMMLAQMAGIDILSTTGLGGVHRDGENTMDISADLLELGRTSVAVISSGCKSFLDLPRSLEYLETQGVFVSTFSDGRIGDIDFPSFYSRESGVKSPSVVHDEREAAAVIYARKLLRINSGILYANPIPLEHSIPISELDAAIEGAVREASEKGYNGSSNTPFIMARIKECSERSVHAMRGMIEANVKVSAMVAIELSKLKME